MNYAKYLIISSIILLITACGSSTTTEFIADDTGIVKAQDTDPMTLDTVKWEVIRNENKLSEFKENNDYPFFIMSREEYDKLSSNIVEIIRYIKDQKSSIDYYENVIDQIDNSTKEQND